eukprot:EG_transcript_20299
MLDTLNSMVDCVSLQMAGGIVALRCGDCMAALAALRDAFHHGAGFSALVTAYWVTWPARWPENEGFADCFTVTNVCRRIMADIQTFPAYDLHTKFFLDVMTGKALAAIGDVDSSRAHLERAASYWPLRACLAADHLGLRFQFIQPPASGHGGDRVDVADCLRGAGEELL